MSRKQADAADEWAANRHSDPRAPDYVIPDGPASETTVAGNTAAMELSAQDLPAYCPNPNMPLWSTHPRVFLDVVNEQESMCPYCGTRYRLKRGAHVRAHEFDTRDLHQDRHQEYAAQPVTEPRAPDRLTQDRESPEMAMDALGNTTLEQMTRLLRGGR